MDEAYRDDRLIYHSQRIKNDSKKEFIEKWLVNLAGSYEESGLDNKDLDSKLATLESENARSSQLDFWDVSEANYKSRKKVSKLQFLNALKNIFKKKKGIYGNDVIVGNSLTESAFNIMSLDTYRQENTSDEPVEDEEQYKSSEDDELMLEAQKQDDSTQTALGVRATTAVAIKPMDQFSRGFSEILQPKGYNFQEEIVESTSMSSFSQMGRSQDESKESYESSKKDERSKEKPKVTKDGWAVIDEEQEGFKQVCHRTDAEWPIRCFKCGIDQTDSYIEKVQLIKRFFAKGQTKPSRKGKTSLTLISVPIMQPRGGKCESIESCALTKDLTDVPYLREHERVQWQGKNKGLWFRINALYSKYRQNDMDANREKLSPKPSSKNERSSCVSKPPTLINSKASSRKTVPMEKVKITKVTSFGSMDRHARLEEMFVSERVKHIEIQMEPFICRPIEKGKTEKSHHPKQDYGNFKDKSRAKVWHEAVEQVRASMRKMSEEMMDAMRCNSHVSSREMKCQSKISVAMSSSDWEDISSISAESSISRQTFTKIIKPLPNIPYTPSFKRHFRPKF